ncbi:winged helix-turn-helix domain-containing protein [Sphaerisporangium sp. TRM90804]|uniref:winged helix-turn-helix domain-containing protein n=1 Tax=Sphaerisporangium sp. TRM90804 TaxID=3031113 RepID=UPI0024469DE1|nr:winged helix-turn-helix domain-containing protein [Sphaerisporangium sp. TRM90804]MDH2424420.1 winged helix-turn-helix domain-containing protein [Sphaerisporangium sp. TRM90804]
MRTTLNVERPLSVPVGLTLAPGLSMLALITDSLGGRERGAPESWRGLVRSVAEDKDAPIVRSLATPGYSVVPDLVFPGDPVTDIGAETQVEMLRDLPGEALLDELEAIVGDEPPPQWRAAADRPVEWLHGYADLLERTWSVMEDVWKRARPLLDREIERVAIAAARGSMDAVLNGLHDECAFDDGAFSFPDSQPERFHIGSRRLVLMPMLSGPTALVSHLDGPDVVWIGYPLPRAGLLTAEPRPQGKDAPLALLLGDVRATILSNLDRPLTMGRLAKVTRQAPNALTYHCDRLESTGLIRRNRLGREIHIERTDRATALVHLLLAP